jgi:hydrogenase/urease accessory protein HupE
VSPRRLLRTSLLAAAAAALGAETAAAHGIGVGARDKSVLEFVPLGIEHMLLGWDHLLFILGIVLVAGRPGRAAKLITLFVAGHSLTLIVATLSGWHVNATLVDVVIALSVVFVGALGIRGRPENWNPVYAAVFGFGLVHGLGLSTRLQELGLPEDGLLGRVIAFNVGLEIGQLAAIAAMVGVVWIGARVISAWRTVRTVSYAGLVVAGLVAAVVLSLGGFSDEEDAVASRTCTEEDGLEPPPAIGGGHPSKKFFEPGEEYEGIDLVHVIGDGYVVVRYRRDLPSRHRLALARWVEAAPSSVVGAPDPDQGRPIVAWAATRKLTCSSLDLADLERFRTGWVEYLDSGGAG